MPKPNMAKTQQQSVANFSVDESQGISSVSFPLMHKT